MRKLAQSAGILTAAVLAVMALAPMAARASTVVYSDFGPGESFQTANGWEVASYEYVAGSFTSGANFTLSQVDIALSYEFVGTNGATVELVNSAAGLPGSTVLESWTLTGLPNFGSSYTAESLTSSGGVALVSGTQYWVVAEPADSTTQDFWNLNSKGDVGAALLFSGSSWSLVGGASPAFDVLGTPAPAAEPGTPALLLLALGALGFGALRRKRSAISG